MAATVAFLGVWAGIPIATAGVVRSILRRPRDERLPVTAAVAVALLLRIIAALVLHETRAWAINGRGSMSPDDAGIDRVARLLVAGDARSPSELYGSVYTAWVYVAWALYRVWDSVLALRLANALLGTLLVPVLAAAGRRLGGRRAEVGVAWLVAVFPTAVVWSALPLREPLVTLLLAASLIGGLVILFTERRSCRRLVSGCAVVVGSAFALAYTRAYMVPVVLGLFVAAGLCRLVRRHDLAPLLAVGVSGVVVLALLAPTASGRAIIRNTYRLVDDPEASIYNPLSDCEVRECGSTDDGSVGARRPATGGEAQPADSLLSIERKGVVRGSLIALLAGRPVGRSTEFFLLLQPGVVVWWVLLPFMALGTASLVRRGRVEEVIVVAGLVLVVTAFLAASGQGIRHHFMAEPFGLLLAVVGLCRVATTSDRVRRGVLASSGLFAVAALTSVVASVVS